MRKLLVLIPAVALVFAAACEDQPTGLLAPDDGLHAAWEYKVTGGGEWFVTDNNGDRTVIWTVSATDFGDGEVKGQVEMENATTGWKIHGTITCTWFNDDASEAFLGLEVTQTQTAETNFVIGDIFGIYVAEDAGLAGEDLGYWSKRSGMADSNPRSVVYACANGPDGWVSDNGFPYFPFNGILVDGNLNIRD